MQKAKANQKAKWALQDAIHLLAQGKDATLTIGYQREPREIITHMNQDRPGGHRQINTNQDGYIISDPYMKQKNRKKDRQKQKRYAKECLEFHWDDLENYLSMPRGKDGWFMWDTTDPDHPDYEDDWDDYREEYLMDDPWNGYDDLHWDDWRDYDYGPYDDYDCGSSYSLTHQNAEWKIEGILINLLDGTISFSDAKKQIMGLL